MIDNVVSEMVNPFWDEVAPLLIEPRERDNPWSFTAIWRRVESEQAQWGQRKTFCAKYAWAVPDPESVAFVAHHLGPRAVEIGAGTGYWAYLLAQHGVDMLCFDEAPPDKVINNYFGVYDSNLYELHRQIVKTWHLVLQDGPEILVEHADRSLFLCWPPYAESMAYHCLQRYQGRRMVYIGEGQGGCNGDDAFFEELEKNWSEVAEHDIVQWAGIHDYIVVYDRKEEASDARLDV